MGKKLLPLLEKKPTLENARARLGGKATGGAPIGGRSPGCIVLLGDKPAAIVFASDVEVHVLLDATARGARMRKARLAEVTLYSGEIPAELASIADDASVFALLAEGQQVRYADDTGALREAKLVEKCRYGALVARDDGTIVAVGFRNVHPVRAEDKLKAA